MNSNELNSTRARYTAPLESVEAMVTTPRGVTRRQAARFWSAFATVMGLVVALVWWWSYAPGQDHMASIPLDGDGTRYANYEPGAEIQDFEILYDGIGHSIENAQQADIIFIGWSRLIFGLDWRVLEAFERKHHLKTYNLGLAGVSSGDFYLRIIQRWGLHPKLWVINADRDLDDYHSGFFYMSLDGGSGTSAPARVVTYSRLHAFKNVIGRNIRWRLKMAAGLFRPWSYRSVSTGNWDLDRWPSYIAAGNAPIKLATLSYVDGRPVMSERTGESCPPQPEEIEGAKSYVKAIGGDVALVQVPSAFACAQRVRELAAAVGVPAFTTDPTQFTSIDGGGHLDGPSAHRYSLMLAEWLERLAIFRRSFPR